MLQQQLNLKGVQITAEGAKLTFVFPGGHAFGITMSLVEIAWLRIMLGAMSASLKAATKETAEWSLPHS